MKKYFKYYAIIWALIIFIFNIVTLVISAEARGGLDSLGGTFWFGYVFTNLSFAVQLACSWIFFKEENKSKVFLNIPIISISYTALLFSAFVGVFCMVFDSLPEWLGGLICAVATALYAIAIIKSKTAVDVVADIDTKIKNQTFFIKSLTVDAESVMARASTPEIKADAKKVYEAIRYSDPMSVEALAPIETQITLRFSAFTEAVINSDAASAKAIANEIVILANDRNKKCKLLK